MDSGDVSGLTVCAAKSLAISGGFFNDPGNQWPRVSVDGIILLRLALMSKLPFIERGVDFIEQIGQVGAGGKTISP